MWRNVARLYARTRWVLMLDVDFAVCTDVRARFRDAFRSDRHEGGIGSLAQSGRAVFVVPAFEYTTQADGNDWKTFPRNKEVHGCITAKHSVSADTRLVGPDEACRLWLDWNVSSNLGTGTQ